MRLHLIKNEAYGKFLHIGHTNNVHDGCCINVLVPLLGHRRSIALTGFRQDKPETHTSASMLICVHVNTYARVCVHVVFVIQVTEHGKEGDSIK